jgi:probable F420-dependent oxidoreductase
MELGRIGVVAAWETLAPAEFGAGARRLEELGYGMLWTGENTGREPFAQLAFVAAATERLGIGTSIASIWARSAGTAKAAARTLVELSGGRFALGLGVSHPDYVEQWWGHDFARPVERMRAYLADFRAAEMGPEAETPPVLVAALRPRMLALAAEAADGATLYLADAAKIAETRAALGPEKTIAASLAVAIGPSALARAREYVETYRDSTIYGPLLAALDDPEARLVGIGLEGVRERIAELREAGADHVALFTLDAEPWYAPDFGTLEALA